MPLKLSLPTEKDFVLERSDLAYGNDGEPTRVSIRQATQSQNEKRSHIYSEVTNVINRDPEDLIPELQLRQHWSLEELKRVEVFLTLTSCNILDPNGSPLFRFKMVNDKSTLDMNNQEFAIAWGKLPGDIALEIHEKVLEVNPLWDGPLGR
jgi:hypothetical protein